MKNKAIKLLEHELTAFEQAKLISTEATSLVHPVADAPLCLMVDASDVAVGGIFQQYQAKVMRAIAFFPNVYSLQRLGIAVLVAGCWLYI